MNSIRFTRTQALGPRTLHSGRAFTFLEIMIVVVIIGIMAALIAPKLAGSTRRARVAATKLQMEHLGTALKRYEMDMGGFPESEGLKALIQKPSSDDTSSWAGPYLDRGAIPKDSWEQEFIYKFPGEHNKDDFDLSSNGPDRQSGTDDDLTNWANTPR